MPITQSDRFVSCPWAAVLVVVAIASTICRAQDVTYADIYQTMNHGQVGAIRAYSLGTRTCNISDLSLSWVGNGTPGVGFNMFKLSNGRLTQIGMSWVKHACCVSNSSNSLCGSSCSGTGFGLRPHCMDTYSASWNSSQSRMGARAGINPYTAAFSPLNGTSGDAIFKRLQVAQSDLASAGGVQHFVDGVYVCTEEAMMPTQYNNGSYRRVTVNQSTFDLTVVDTTQIGIPGIRAWRDHGLGPNTPDNSVTVDTFEVANEGRYWSAYKVTDLGGGQYRYDYAIYNLNSDVAGGSFSVPVPGGALVSNIGFNCPLYHSGEPYSNAPWTSALTPGSLTWSSPQTYAQNPNSNALRWATMYNFWFDCNRPPAPGNVVMGLFKPHSPPSASFRASIPAGCLSSMADLNADLSINGGDVSHFVRCLLSSISPGGDCTCADMNQNGALDPGDIDLFSNQLVSP